MSQLFTIEPKVFRDAVAWTARWVPGRPAVPEWAGMRLEVGSGQLGLSAYDEDVSAHSVIDIDGNAAGVIVVSGKLLAALAGTFPVKQQVEAEIGDTLLTLRAGRVVVTLPLMGATGFPRLPDTPPTVGTINGEELASAVGKVAIAAGRDPSQPIWTGIRLALAGNRMEMMAGHRPQYARTFVPVESDSTAEVLVPAALLAEVVRTMADADRVEIGANENLASFSTLDRTLVTRQLAGPYPTAQMHTVFGWQPPMTAMVAVADLLAAVKRTMLLRNDEHPTVLTWAPGELTVSARGGAEAGETIDVEYDGKPGRMGCNPAYLAAGLEAIGAANAVIGFDPGNPKRPLVITDPDDAEYRYAMAPIKLRAS